MRPRAFPVADEDPPSVGVGAPSEPSFSEQVAALHPRLLRRALMMFRGDEAEADDLVQNIVVKALEKEDRFQKGTNLHAWLAKMLTHAFIDKMRSDGRFQIDAGVDVERLAKTPDEPVDRTNPIEIYGSADVRRVAQKLPAKQRLVFMEFHFNDRSFKDIYTAHGIPMGSIGVILSRARAKVRNWLEDESEGEDE
ncbi:MAG: RNA polymerase sigma factor [Myxococcota bacterium]